MESLISYEEFSEIVPKETKEFIDNFLVISSSYLIDKKSRYNVMEIPLIIALIKYMHDDYSKVESSTKICLESYGYKLPEITNGEKQENTIIEMYEKYAKNICVCQNEYEYLYLTPEKILYMNLQNVGMYFAEQRDFGEFELLPNELRVFLDDYGIGTVQGFKGVYKDVYLSAEKKAKRQLFDINLSKMPIETISYLETVSYVCDYLKCIDNDSCVAALVAALYYNSNCSHIIEYFESIGLSKSIVFEYLNEINVFSKKVNNFTLTEKKADYGKILYHFKNYLNLKKTKELIIDAEYIDYIDFLIKKSKELQNNVESSDSNPSIQNTYYSTNGDYSVHIEEIIGSLIDRNITKSIIFEKLLAENNIDVLKFKYLEKNIKEQKKCGDKKIIEKLYKTCSVKNVKYIEELSKIYSIFDENNKNSNFKVKYSEDELAYISILFSILKRNNNIANYLGSKDITMQKFLDYFGMLQNDINIENREIDNKYLVLIFDWLKNRISIDRVTINEIMMYIFPYKNDEKIVPILRNINPIFWDIPNILKEIEVFKDDKEKEYRMNTLKKFYGNLNIDVIKYIEKAALIYNEININDKFSINDKIELSLMVSFLNTKKDDAIAEYIYNTLFNKKIYSMLGISKEYISKNRDIFDKNIDLDIMTKHFAKYIFGGKNSKKNKNEISIIDIVHNLFNKELYYSILLEEFLNKVDISYDDFDNIEQKIEDKKNKDFEKLKQNVMAKLCDNIKFEDADNLDKIYRIIQKKCFFGSKDIVAFAAMIYLYYVNDNLVEIFNARKITIEEILKYLNISKEEIDKYKELETDYYSINENSEFLYKSVHVLIKNIMNDIMGKKEYADHVGWAYIAYEKFHSFIESIVDFGDIYPEIMNEKKYVEPLTKDEILENYSKLPIPKLEINKIEDITDFGTTLTEQSELITKDFSDFVSQTTVETDESTKLQNAIKNISKENNHPRVFQFLKKQETKNESEKFYTKKEVLDKLDIYLSNKSVVLRNGLKELQYIRMSIGIYLSKAKSYLEVLEQAKNDLNNEINGKKYLENDFRIFDDQLRQQLLNDKIHSINLSMLQMLQQYQRITMQMATHASLINQIDLSRSTTLQNLYIELSLNEGVTKEKNAIDSLQDLEKLLANMSLLNNNGTIQNIEMINNISKNNMEKVIKDEDKILIDKILEEQGLLPSLEDKEEKTRTRNI